MGYDALVARSLEGVQPFPMRRQVGGLEDVNPDIRAVRIKNQCWISKAGTPAGMDEHSADVACKPAAFKPVELMLVGATRCKGSVRRQAMEGRVCVIPTA